MRLLKVVNMYNEMVFQPKHIKYVKSGVTERKLLYATVYH